MWLLYLRFDDHGQAVTMHVRCDGDFTAKQIMKLAQQHGLTARARLVEYAYFSSGLTIQPRDVPTFPVPQCHYYTEKMFREQWEKIGKS